MLPDELAVHLRAARLGGQVPPFDVRWLPSTTSTMDMALALARDGAPHGVVVVADEQTAGRGRRGTTWASPAGAGLYFSLIARPGQQAAPSTLSLITLAAGVAVREGVSAATGLAPDLKWPNDLMVDKRKLAGILAEGVAIGSSDQAVVIGVGVNLQPAAYPPDVAARATSIEGELGRAFERGELLAAILLALWDRVAGLERNPGDILQAWRAASPSARGTRVEWDATHGTTAGIDDGGALLVNTSAGVERIIAGELRWML
jgi:BirA family transcriptional regulator, biotin operon repressor / biotin---[acetyl-CoA-carboxylase] ligase